MILIFGHDSTDMKGVLAECRAKGDTVNARNPQFFRNDQVETCEKVILLSEAPEVAEAYHTLGVHVEDRTLASFVKETPEGPTFDFDKTLELPWMKAKSVLKQNGFEGSTKAAAIEWAQREGYR